MVNASTIPEERKKLSRNTKATIVAVILVAVSVIGIFGAHSIALNDSLSLNNLILSQEEIDSIVPNSSDWQVPYLPSSNNVASADYTNGTPLPAFGGNVTSPNIVIFVMRSSSSASALSGYNSLQSHLKEVISNGISPCKLVNISLGNYSGKYFGFYNSTKGVGAIVTVEGNYVVVTTVYNLGLNALVHSFWLQVDKISRITEFDSAHFIL